jgi:hypothetical protein
MVLLVGYFVNYYLVVVQPNVFECSLEYNYKTSHSLFICRQVLHSPVSVHTINMNDREFVL